MSAVRLGVLVAALAASSGCTAVLNFKQCSTDADCAHFVGDGEQAFCTADQICVTDYPDDRICALDVVSSARADAVTLAGLFRLTGASGEKDTELARAVELAVDEINQAGKRGLRLVLCDSGGDPERARKALGRAVATYSAVAVVGVTTSSELIALARDGDSLVAKLGVLVVSSSATAPAVSALADEDLVWRTAASDTLQGQVLAGLVPAGASPVASAYISASYGMALNAAFTAALGLLTPPVVPVAKAFAEGAAGGEVAGFLTASSPQVALLVADADVPAWVAALDLGGAPLATTQFLLTDAARSPALLATPPSTTLLDRISGTAPTPATGPVYNAFQGAFEVTYGTDPGLTPYVANAYDATYAIAIAMGAIPPESPVTGRLLAEGMKRLSTPGGMPISVGASDFAAAYQQLAGGGVVNLQGTSGPIDFDPRTGDVLGAPMEIWGIDTARVPPAFVTRRIVPP